MHPKYHGYSRQQLEAMQTKCKEESIQKSGVELIAAERARQINTEGWTAEHDDSHQHGEMIIAACCYAKCDARQPIVPSVWPWELEWWKPKSKLKNLIRAGALIAAEIDRLQRAAFPKTVL